MEFRKQKALEELLKQELPDGRTRDSKKIKEAVNLAIAEKLLYFFIKGEVLDIRTIVEVSGIHGWEAPDIISSLAYHEVIDINY